MAPASSRDNGAHLIYHPRTAGGPSLFPFDDTASGLKQAEAQLHCGIRGVEAESKLHCAEALMNWPLSPLYRYDDPD